MKAGENVSVEIISMFVAENKDPDGRKLTFGDVLWRIGFTMKDWQLTSKAISKITEAYTKLSRRLPVPII